MHDDVAGYALDALDELEQKRFERHLRGCDTCRADLPSLQSAAVALAFAAAPVPAPAALQRPAWRRRRLLVPALAAAAAALAAVVLTHAQHEAQTVALVGVAGRLVVERDRTARLEVKLPAALPGAHYEAWVVHDDRRAAAGSFRRGGTVVLLRPVPRGDRVAVTVEPGGRVVATSERA
jgi:anti-sigma factor RsiW